MASQLSPPVGNSPPSELELLPLGSRYSAAWIEHGTRVTQRQNCIQIYLASAGIVFGFYALADAEKQKAMAPLLMVGVSFLTIASAMLIHMHLRVMQRLCDFMMRCEKHACASPLRLIGQVGDGPDPRGDHL